MEMPRWMKLLLIYLTLRGVAASFSDLFSIYHHLRSHMHGSPAHLESTAMCWAVVADTLTAVLLAYALWRTVKYLFGDYRFRTPRARTRAPQRLS